MLLLTGASGFLGKIAYNTLSNVFDTVGLAFSSSFNSDFVRFDLTETKSIIPFLDKLNPDIIVHSAACRDPDKCESDPDFVYNLNVDATSKIAEWCMANNVKLIYISTDYVFDGTAPPYLEADQPNPLSYYGRTKALGESAVIKCKDHIIVRIPLQYGFSQPEKDSFLIKVLEQFSVGKPLTIDDSQIRFPTLSNDVAQAIVNLIELNYVGIIHLSGPTALTRFAMWKTIAEVFDYPVSLLKRMDLPEVKDAKRPENSRMDTSLYESLCNHKFRSFREGLEYSKKLMIKAEFI